jgi:hypothetical protein
MNMDRALPLILYTSELSARVNKGKKCYSQKDFFSPYPVHGTPFSSSSLLLKRV